MKTLYLHIGTMKTGTTYIQHFCYRNIEQLKAQGISFPVFSWRYGVRSPARNGIFLAFPLYTDTTKTERLREEEDQRVREGLARVSEELKTSDKVLLTDETLWFNTMTYRPGIWQELKDWGEANDCRIEIIVYLRRQIEYMESFWNQYVKHVYGGRTLKNFLNNYDTLTCPDYAAGLKKILEVFPQENLIVRRYDISSFPDGSVLGDFMQVCGIREDPAFVLPEDDAEANVRLSGNMVEIKWAVNQMKGMDPSDYALSEQACIGATGVSNRFYKKELLSAEEKRQWMESFEEGNAWIAEYLIRDGKPLFNDVYPEKELWKKNNSYMLPDVVRFAAYSDILLQRRIEEQETQIRELKKQVEMMRKELDREKNTGRVFREKVRHPVRTLIGRASRLLPVLCLAAGLMLSGCGDNDGTSKSSGEEQAKEAQTEAESGSTKLTNVSYDPTRELYAAYNEWFAEHYKETAQQDVEIVMSHGGSGGQARSVVEGASADVVTLALEHDITLIEKSGLIEEGWLSEFPNDSSPYTSTIVFLVRKGNEKQIRDWDDLVKEGVGVITPDPKSSGGACWNFLAAWHFADLQFGGDEAQIMDFMTKLYANVLVMDSGARGATATFVENGQGDVLIAWENEALQTLREYPDEYEMVSPSVSILAQPSVAVVDENARDDGNEDLAHAYLSALYEPEAQEIIGTYGYRPSDPEVLSQFSDTFDLDMNLCTIQDFGGWNEAFDTYFQDGGIFDEVYGS